MGWIRGSECGMERVRSGSNLEPLVQLGKSGTVAGREVRKMKTGQNPSLLTAFPG